MRSESFQFRQGFFIHGLSVQNLKLLSVQMMDDLFSSKLTLWLGAWYTRIEHLLILKEKQIFEYGLWYWKFLVKYIIVCVIKSLEENQTSPSCFAWLEEKSFITVLLFSMLYLYFFECHNHQSTLTADAAYRLVFLVGFFSTHYWVLNLYENCKSW